MFLNTFDPSRDLVLAGGAILPAPVVPASTRISATLKRGQEHRSPVSGSGEPRPFVMLHDPLQGGTRHLAKCVPGCTHHNRNKDMLVISNIYA